MSFDLVRFGELFLTPQKNGLTRPKRVRGSGVPMVNMGELFSHPRIRNLEMDRVPLAAAEAEFLLAPGDLLFARQSLVLAGAGQCSLFLGNTEPTTFESHLIRCRLDRKRADPIFYYYFFRSRDGRRTIEAIVEQGAGASGIRGSDLVNVQVLCPPLSVQTEVAATLGALDDRIALLREANVTLEAIAQALFKSWFVDFDPVRAKSQGLTPAGMDEATAGLFPDGFADSALGPIPIGWRIEPLSSVCESIFSGGTPNTREPKYWRGTLRWFSSGETRDTVIVDTEKRISLDAVQNSSTRLAKPGDVLIASAGQGTTRGQTSFCAVETYINQSVVAVRTDASRGDAAWTFLNLARRYDEMRILSDSHSIRGSLTTKILAGMKLVLPPVSVMHSFGALVGPLLCAQAENRRSSATLAEIRDALLPRLISGQLRLPEIEAIAEAVL